jgi:hypothetical protein
LVEGGFFDVKSRSLDILVIVPTKSWSKYMMRRKAEESNSCTKVT